MKQQFEVSDLDTDETYYVSSWEEGRDNTDKSAIKEVMKTGDVITVGKIIVFPVMR